jgi:hypothetical protein
MLRIFLKKYLFTYKKLAFAVGIVIYVNMSVNNIDSECYKWHVTSRTIINEASLFIDYVSTEIWRQRQNCPQIDGIPICIFGESLPYVSSRFSEELESNKSRIALLRRIFPNLQESEWKQMAKNRENTCVCISGHIDAMLKSINNTACLLIRPVKSIDELHGQWSGIVSLYVNSGISCLPLDVCVYYLSIAEGICCANTFKKLEKEHERTFEYQCMDQLFVTCCSMFCVDSYRPPAKVSFTPDAERSQSDFCRRSYEVLDNLLAIGDSRVLGKYPDGADEIRGQFANSRENIAHFMSLCSDDVRSSIFKALASQNHMVAEAALIVVSDMAFGLGVEPFSGKKLNAFFVALGAEPPIESGEKFVLFNAGRMIKASPAVDPRRDDAIERQCAIFVELWLKKYGAEKFFASEGFAWRIQELCEKTPIATHAFFKDLNRSGVQQFYIGDQQIDLRSCKNVQSSIKIVLENIQCQFSSDEAFPALMSLLYYPWTQGECTRLTIAYKDLSSSSYGISTEQQDLMALGLEFLVKEAHLHTRTTVHINNNGTIRIKSFGYCGPIKDERRCFAVEQCGIVYRSPWLYAYTDMTCDSKGKTQITKAHLAFHT